MTSPFEVSARQVALTNAAAQYEAQAERLAGEIEALSGLGVHSGGEGVHAGVDDLDALIGGKVDEIVEALAGAGERLQQISTNLNTSARNYQQVDGEVAGGMDEVHR